MNGPRLPVYESVQMGPLPCHWTRLEDEEFQRKLAEILYAIQEAVMEEKELKQARNLRPKWIGVLPNRGVPLAHGSQHKAE